MGRVPQRIGLILGDGGARAAYQVGVLKAVREVLPDARLSPFPIIGGASGGAINAGILAAWAEDFATGVAKLEAFWSTLRVHDVYRAGLFGFGMRRLAALTGTSASRRPNALFDNAPLRRRLEQAVDFGRIDAAIARHALLAVGVTCSGYDSGQSVTFFQGRADLDPWRRPQRVAAHVKLTVDHLMASLAMPFVFPAVRLHREWFGDGAMRQVAPLSPAVHLGAQRILAIGGGPMASAEERASGDGYPSPAQIAGHVLSGLLVDSLGADLECALRINRKLALLPDDKRQDHRHIDILHISPSQRLDRLAADHVDALPRSARAPLRSLGGLEEKGSALTSCLLFEPSYARALIDLGYADAMARKDELKAFFA